MELLNATQFQAGYTLATQKDGRELLVVAVKGTYTIPERAGEPRLAAQQRPLIEADTFTGDPGFSAPRYEADFAPVKKRCDVLLLGSAYAPGGRPATRVEVSLRVGSVFKSFAVTGDRFWEAGNIAISPGYAGQFEVMPISYDLAFGGVDNFHQDEKKHSAFMQNPVGKGFHRQLGRSLVNGTPMPNTEELKRAVTMPNGNCLPMSFGPVARGWEPRSLMAGTYDQAWLDNTFPFLPADFDDGHFQAAPADQQMSYPQGGEGVFLENLNRQGQLSFQLPDLGLPVVFFRKRGGSDAMQAVVDTIVLEPDEGVFSLTWRATLPLQRNIFEISQVLVGRQTKAWWRARELGKQYAPSIAHLARRKKMLLDEVEE
ncbi:MAG: DUF2169 domain-containing protein [Candidatus Thiodiazotropha sp. (ex Dulcina madagascariensis)]|nr:DUF2169 domain-containing protein [Candidatus Thiodiazotropha sp. (ex Dulcina madagascariensis)]